MTSTTTTLVLYMPGPDYAEVSARLRDGGLPADLPCAVISAASNARQLVPVVHNFAPGQGKKNFSAPALLIVGRVAWQHAKEIIEQAWAALDESIPAPSIARFIYTNLRRETRWLRMKTEQMQP